MAYYVYILQSRVNDSFYKGITNDLSRRLAEHNNREEKSTCSYVPWDLVWKIFVPSKSEAYRLEKKLKNLTRSRLITFMKKYPVDPEVGGPDVSVYRELFFW
jgi:putative endonuclease